VAGSVQSPIPIAIADTFSADIPAMLHQVCLPLVVALTTIAQKTSMPKDWQATGVPFVDDAFAVLCKANLSSLESIGGCTPAIWAET
jgi:hypothetical protein